MCSNSSTDTIFIYFYFYIFIFFLQMSGVPCQASHVMCHVSCFKCPLSPVTCHKRQPPQTDTSPGWLPQYAQQARCCFWSWHINNKSLRKKEKENKTKYIYNSALNFFFTILWEKKYYSFVHLDVVGDYAQLGQTEPRTSGLIGWISLRVDSVKTGLKLNTWVQKFNQYNVWFQTDMWMLQNMGIDTGLL